MVFDDVPQSDERSYQQAALAAGDMVPRTIRGDRIGPLLELERVIDHMGEPFLAPNLFLHWGMYRAAKASGTAVFLDGLDGDTTVSHGTARITELALAGRWPTLLREVRTVSRRFNTPMGSVFRTCHPPMISDRLRAIRRRLFGQQFLGPPTRLQLNEAFARRTNFAARAAEFAYADRKMPVTEKAAHLRSLSRGLLSRVLDVADRASAAFSIEARYPFFDRRLIEFCLGVPANQKLRDGWTRWIMRQAMDGILPAEISGAAEDLGPNFVHTLHTIDRDRLAAIRWDYVGCAAVRRHGGGGSRYRTGPPRLCHPPGRGGAKGGGARHLTLAAIARRTIPALRRSGTASTCVSDDPGAVFRDIQRHGGTSRAADHRALRPGFGV